MPPRRRVRRLKLGPIVGHTDDTSARVWIQAGDDPSSYLLRVAEAGLFPFASTAGGGEEFGTAIARVTGLQPDRRYGYRVVRRGRFVPGSEGSFRTFPPPASMTDLMFCAVSCNGAEELGAWEKFAAFVNRSQPSFILMMGDQVYLDEDQPDVYHKHLDSDSSTRRQAMADMYQANWSREPLRNVFANFPVYMVWDDHDVRDGFGSLAHDSPTMVARYPRGKAIFAKTNAYFEDARDVYWHFQACRNPMPEDTPDPSLPNIVEGPVPRGIREAMPFVFRCGRLVVLVLESRGGRDLFRKELPILGARQWAFIEEVFANLPDDVEALAVVTSTPIASQDPDGQSQRLLGTRTDDVDAFRKGDERAALRPRSTGPDDLAEVAKTVLSARFAGDFGVQLNLGSFQLSNMDEARDQWSHRASRGEQARLVKGAFAACAAGQNPGSERSLIFLSGDIHIGCIFEISAWRSRTSAVSLTSSGISKIDDTQPLVGIFVDEDFAVAPGLRSTLRQVANQFNFGIVHVQPTGRGAVIEPALESDGSSWVYGVEIGGLF